MEKGRGRGRSGSWAAVLESAQLAERHTVPFKSLPPSLFLGPEPPFNSHDPPLRVEEDCVGTNRGLTGWGIFINIFPGICRMAFFLFALKLSNGYFQRRDFWKIGGPRVTFQEIRSDLWSIKKNYTLVERSHHCSNRVTWHSWREVWRAIPHHGIHDEAMWYHWRCGRSRGLPRATSVTESESIRLNRV